MKRNTGLDVYRVYAMFGVLILHILASSLDFLREKFDSPAFWVLWAIAVFARGAVDMFGLLTGYLGCERKRYGSRRILEIFTVSLFWCVLISCLTALLVPGHISNVRTLFKGMLPFYNSQWWYIVCYMGLFFLIPYLNRLLQSMTVKQHRGLCALCFVLFSVMPLLLRVDLFQLQNGFSLAWLVVLYIYGAYLGRTQDAGSVKRHLALWIVPLLIAYCGLFLHLDMTKESPKNPVGYNSPLILLSVMALLRICAAFGRKCKRPSPKLLVLLSSVSLEVYLIHTQNFSNQLGMRRLFARLSELSWPLFVLAVPAGAIGLYLVCTLLALLRKQLFRLLRIDRLLKALSVRVDRKLYANINGRESESTPE